MNDTNTPTNTTIKIGDIFVSSWGYDQTNVDFYQVVQLKGKSVYVRRISCKVEQNGMMCGEATPVKNSFTGEVKRHLLKGNCFKVSSYSYAQLTDETSKHYCSWYH